jgi:hypothetical protein
MFPLWIFGLVYNCRDIKKLLKALIVVVASAATWFIPTIILAWGLENYLSISKWLFTIHFSDISVFYGASIAKI